MFGSVESFCLFACYTRSGHSLVGTILDAHPHAVVAHEAEIFKAADGGRALTGELKYRNRDRLFNYLSTRSERHAAKGHRGRRRGEPFPLIAGASNGEVTELKMIGVKRGQEPPLVWEKNPAIFDDLESLVGVPVRLLHVYRNPWDNIASMSRARKDTWDEDEAAAAAALRVGNKYFRRADLMRAIKEKYEVYDLALEDLIADPAKEIGALLDHLGLERDGDFVEKAAAAVDESPTASRHEHEWSDAQIDAVVKRKRQIPWLERYPDSPE